MDTEIFSDIESDAFRSPLEVLNELKARSFNEIFDAQPLDEEALRFRLNRIRRSQQEYDRLFSRLDHILTTLNEKQAIALNDETNLSWDSSYTPSPSPNAHRCRPSNGASLLSSEYPKLLQRDMKNRVVIGPNGTEVEAEAFSSIVWDSAPAATRSLLCLVFSGNELATRTLTGKPSPAFYGRERPAKLKLDPIKTADIIHCVRIKCGCKERDVRAAITTKCADTAKKLKRLVERFGPY